MAQLADALEARSRKRIAAMAVSSGGADLTGHDLAGEDWNRRMLAFWREWQWAAGKQRDAGYRCE